MPIFQCASGLVLPSTFHLSLCSECALLQEERESGNEGVQEEKGEQGVGEESKVSVATSSIYFIYNVQPNTRWGLTKWAEIFDYNNVINLMSRGKINFRIIWTWKSQLFALTCMSICTCSPPKIFLNLKLPAKCMYSSKRHLPLYKQIVYEIKITIRKKKKKTFTWAHMYKFHQWGVRDAFCS